MDTIRVACGSGYAEDLVELAVEMVEDGGIDFLCMDGLAERTLALAQIRRLEGTGAGYDLRLEAIARDLLPAVQRRGVKLIGSIGGANPAAAGEYLQSVSREHGFADLVIGVVEGDDVREQVLDQDLVVLETGAPVSQLPGTVVSANAYIGAEAPAALLEQGADVVIGGRLADPSLYVAPIAQMFGWSWEDWDRLGAATAIGHLLECGTHVTGGNFADPPYRIVPSFEHPGFPYADVRPDGSGLVGKLEGTDGLFSLETCKVQLGYEIHDPRRYITPDVCADFSNVHLDVRGSMIDVTGARGAARPDDLKVLIGVEEGYIGDGQVSFAGPGAMERAQLARTIAISRIRALEEHYPGAVCRWRADLLGWDGILGAPQEHREDPPEVHLRVALHATEQAVAAEAAHSIEYIQVFGPAATAGHLKGVRRLVGMYSTLLSRDQVPLTTSLYRSTVAA